MEIRIQRYATHHGEAPYTVATVELWEEIMPGASQKRNEVELRMSGEFANEGDVRQAAATLLRANGFI